MKIIGVGHYSRTGKDSFAKYLVASLTQIGTTSKKLSFAWKLKQICHELYSWAGMRQPEFYDTPEGEPYRDIVLPAIGKTPVEIWVDFGTPAVRHRVYDRTWIDFALRTNHSVDVLVIPDVRFPNEVEAVRELNGTLIKIVRPGYGPRPTVADRALIGWNGWDYTIGSSGEMKELGWWANEFAWHLKAGTLPYQSQEAREAATSVEVIIPWEQAA